MSDWLLDVKKAGVQPSEIAIFVRSAAELDRAEAADYSSRMDWTAWRAL